MISQSLMNRVDLCLCFRLKWPPRQPRTCRILEIVEPRLGRGRVSDELAALLCWGCDGAAFRKIKRTRSPDW